MASSATASAGSRSAGSRARTCSMNVTGGIQSAGQAAWARAIAALHGPVPPSLGSAMGVLRRRAHAACECGERELEEGSGPDAPAQHDRFLEVPTGPGRVAD